MSRYLRHTTLDSITAGKLYSFGVIDPSQPVSVVVWGDSYAQASLPAFDALFKQSGFSGRAATHSGTVPVLGLYLENHGLAKDSLRFNAEVVSYIESNRVPHVVLVANWGWYARDGASSGRLPGGLSPNSTNQMQAALLGTVEKIVSVGAQPWILLEVPLHPGLPGPPHDITVLFRQHWMPLASFNDSRFCAKPGPDNGLGSTDPLFIKQLTKAGARIIDPRPAFLNSSEDLYPISRDGVLLYFDHGHMTKKGAEKMLTPVLEKAFLPFLTRAASSKYDTLAE
jgi:hypothetical protein